jgi:hypothetical protein
MRPLLAALALLLVLPFAARAGEPDATAPGYGVDLRGSDGGFRWQGRETIAITNPGTEPLSGIVVRLWGNGARRCARPRWVVISKPEGGVLGDSTRRACTAVRVKLDTPIAPGARGSVAFDVDIRVPRHRRDRFGRGGKGVALLSNAIPAIAHREDGRWRLDRWFGSGEAWTYPAAEWRVRLTAPDRVRIAAPGVLQPDGARLLRGGRDYSFAAGRLRKRSARVAGVAVSAWAPRAAPARKLRRALDVTKRRLPRLIELFGPFGWPDLQVVVTDAAAMEHTGLIMTPPDAYIVVHELAHEWWFGSVGDDQAESPWLDEGFATYAEEAVLGQKPWCRRPGPDARLMTRGTDFWRHRLIRYGVVYFEGACLLDLIERRMGRPLFRATLRDYAIANRYGWSTAPEFRAAMDSASPRGLGDLWRRFGVAPQ